VLAVELAQPIRFAIVTSALLSFLTSFDEVIMALFVSGGDNSTLTRNMFNALRDQIDPTITASRWNCTLRYWSSRRSDRRPGAGGRPPRRPHPSRNPPPDPPRCRNTRYQMRFTP
jgi:hypothetical protein